MASNNSSSVAVSRQRVCNLIDTVGITCAATTPQAPRQRPNIKYVKPRRPQSSGRHSKHGISRKKIRPHRSSVPTQLRRTLTKEVADASAHDAILEGIKPSTSAKERLCAALPPDDTKREAGFDDDRQPSPEKDWDVVSEFDPRSIKRAGRLPSVSKLAKNTGPIRR